MTVKIEPRQISTMADHAGFRAAFEQVKTDAIKLFPDDSEECHRNDFIKMHRESLLKGTDPKFWSKIAIFFLAEKASSGMWEICPKISGGYEY